MGRTRSRRRVFINYVVALLQFVAIASPLSAPLYAQENPAEPVPCVAPANAPRPTGVAAHTYTWNCGSGLWENPYYTWNPASQVATARFAPEHIFNEAQQLWQIWEWRYVASSGGYEYRVTSSYAPAPPPAPAVIEDTGPGSTNEITNTGGTITQTGPDSTNSIAHVPGSITNTGPQSDNTLHLDNESQTDLDVQVTVSATNNIDSQAVSGNASVIQNTTGGSALTGDASAMANILNMLQSSWGWNGGQSPSIYTADIQGDYKGDILINPALLGVNNGGCACGDLTVNADIDASIENNVNLLARSGDATVSQNTTGGDATTGDATAVANIVNMISSSIQAGSSFLGILNIHGNFEGDVLVAQDVIDQLIAANVPTTEIILPGSSNTQATFDDSQMINNNIVTSATSGAANVTHNTTGGNATSGSAETSVTVFNITGRHVVGKNALLVFVNVLGEWVGFIMDAPGATAAAFGGGLSQNNIDPAYSGDTEIDADTDMSITNNINVTAETGDAEVSYNTTGGNATSGDAKAVANVSNILSSSFSLSGWFGLLFINVLGDWYGSFGVNTPYGNVTFPSDPVTGGAVYGVSTTTHPTAANNSKHTPAKPLMRAYKAQFSEETNGGVVLTGASETLPPSSTATDQSFGASDSAGTSLVGWALLAAGAGITIFFFRRKQMA